MRLGTTAEPATVDGPLGTRSRKEWATAKRILHAQADQLTRQLARPVHVSRLSPRAAFLLAVILQPGFQNDRSGASIEMVAPSQNVHQATQPGPATRLPIFHRA